MMAALSWNLSGPTWQWLQEQPLFSRERQSGDTVKNDRKQQQSRAVRDTEAATAVLSRPLVTRALYREKNLPKTVEMKPAYLLENYVFRGRMR